MTSASRPSPSGDPSGPVSGDSPRPAAAPDVADHNREVFAHVTGAYLSKELDPSEFWLLRQLWSRWSSVDMLDLGVGAGRTAFTFSAICRSYVGLDPLDEMLSLCRARVGESDRVRFVRGDARDLAAVSPEGFDVVLFSCNGIDALNHGDRLKVLREIAGILKPEGILFFSVHNLRGYPPVQPPAQFNSRDPLRSAYRWLERARFVRRLEAEARRSDLAKARSQGWMSLRDGAHDFQILNFYIDPQLQVDELRQEGFVVDLTLDSTGTPVDVRHVTSSPNVWFCCRHLGPQRSVHGNGDAPKLGT